MSADDINNPDDLLKPTVHDVNKEIFQSILNEFQDRGYFVDSLDIINPELSKIYSRQNASKSPFFDQSNEEVVSINTNKFLGAIHKIIDLHGFSKLSASQALRRIFNYSDRTRPNIIKIIVGRRLHSQKGQILPNVVREVCHELQLPDPIQHKKNDGLMIMLIPAKQNLDENRE